MTAFYLPTLIFLAGLGTYASVSHAMLGLRKPLNRDHLVLAFLCLSCALYGVFQVASLATMDALAQRVEVRADKEGVAIFADVNDWLGRPVQTGERVMQLAQPEDAGVLVWLAVADAINLEPGAPAQLFLHTDPLQPRSGELIEASYQATPSPDGVASYRLRVKFDAEQDLPRIGLRGVVRISGEWVSLGYYVFRRPMAAVREWTGL